MRGRNGGGPLVLEEPDQGTVGPLGTADQATQRLLQGSGRTALQTSYVQFCLGLPVVLQRCKKRKKSARMHVSMLTWSILDLTLPFTSVYSYHELFCYSFLAIIDKEKITICNITIE